MSVRRIDPAAARRAAIRRRAYSFTRSGNAYLRAKRYREAARYYRQALALMPGDRDLRAALVGALAFQATADGQDERSLRYWQEYVRLKPGEKVARSNVAIKEAALAQRRGDTRLAIEKVREALRLTPTQERRDWLKQLEGEASYPRAPTAVKVSAAVKLANAQQVVDQLNVDLKRGESVAQQTGSRVQFMPAPGTPFGIAGSPQAELTGKPGETPKTVPTAAAQASAAAAAGRLSERAPLEDVMREQAQCGFDRGPCVAGKPISATPVTLEGRPRGLPSLPKQVADAVLRTEQGRKLAAEEAQLRARVEQAKEKVAAAKEKLTSATPAEKGRAQLDLVKERQNKDQLTQQLHQKEHDMETYSISFQETPGGEKKEPPRAGPDSAPADGGDKTPPASK